MWKNRRKVESIPLEKQRKSRPQGKSCAFRQNYQPDEISLLCSISSITYALRLIPCHTLPCWKSDQHVDSRGTGGRLIPVQVKGYSVDLNAVAEEISIPVFKVLSQGLHLHTSNTFRPFVSLLKPRKSATWKKNPIARLNPPGSGGASVEGMRHSRPRFKFSACAELVVLGSGSLPTGECESQNKWEESCLTVSNYSLTSYRLQILRDCR